MAMPSLAFAQPKQDKLRALGIMALNGMFDEMDGVSVLRQAVNELLPGDIAIVSSFGADYSVLLHMVAQVDPSLPVYFLETGKHFAETLEYVDTLQLRLGLSNVRWLRPDPKDIARFDPKGDLWETDPDSCCHIRKTEPRLTIKVDEPKKALKQFRDEQLGDGECFSATLRNMEADLDRMTELLGDSLWTLGNCASSRSYYFNPHGEPSLLRPMSTRDAITEASEFPLSDYQIS